MDASDGATSCGTTTNHALTNVYLHGARHAYQGYRASVSNNDQDGDFLPANANPIAPGSIMVDSTTARTVCNYPSIVTGKTYKGDSSYDTDGSPDNASYAWQHDAYQFAALHD